jgi:hypothetical protein
MVMALTNLVESVWSKLTSESPANEGAGRLIRKTLLSLSDKRLKDNSFRNHRMRNQLRSLSTRICGEPAKLRRDASIASTTEGVR